MEPPAVVLSDPDCPKCGEDVWLREDAKTVWGCQMVLYSCPNRHLRITVTPPSGASVRTEGKDE